MRILTRVSALVLFLSVIPACQQGTRLGQKGRQLRPLDDMLRTSQLGTPQDGIAAVILLDTSGSMKDRLVDADGHTKPKLAIAQRALISLIRQFEDFGRKNPERKLLVGIYEFSSRDDEPLCRQVLRLSPPDLSEAEAVLQKIKALGGTPIGNAMIEAKRRLDATGFSHRHILVITDGENNRGYAPGDVAHAIGQRPDGERASIYFIAFDTQASHFDPVRDAGGLVLSASSEKDLNQTLAFVLTGKILVEEPVTPPGR